MQDPISEASGTTLNHTAKKNIPEPPHPVTVAQDKAQVICLGWWPIWLLRQQLAKAWVKGGQGVSNPEGLWVWRTLFWTLKNKIHDTQTAQKGPLTLRHIH